MVKAIGIDPGTMSMDLYGFDDESGEVLIDEAIPREEITAKPKIVVDRLLEVQRRFGRIDAVVGPCGYGMPLKRACEASDADIALATFVTKEDVERRLRIVGLRGLMKILREAKELNVWFTPGVIHLTTVPAWRKANKIDMGTADKVYSVILAVKDQAERLGIRYDETSLILVEVGFAYTSAVAVDRGAIVDAMAGTAGFPSYMGMGFMDSELAYALANSLKGFSKMLLFSGGVAHVAGLDPFKTTPEEFVELAKVDEKVKRGYELMLESIVKDVASLLPSVKPREIVLSGRFTRISDFLKDVEDRLQRFFKELGLSVGVVKLKGRAKVAKEAAEGAALYANGIARGKYFELIKAMKLFESSGKLFDHVYLPREVVEKMEVFEKLS
ncbi:MAG: DUF1464 domain-containing protein [Candidatus Methanomethylicota archaeon]|uniref:DUF1464 domain-containing protein n=1 Tax=Thermoproteota archaeon TaxID=2056631 RepID=A0A497ESA3_9CREN|nr:MAG: DUF1464 domain-containing protein [Candidatus Verstraetearchaeota archaeon]